MATLYVVATPIGNLDDITIRAVETLRSVSVIVCEDTRHTLRLLNHLGIKKPLSSAHSRNEHRAAGSVISRLAAGEDVAYVSDAGTPGISDPGRVLVREVRDAGHDVVPIPGASALSALLSVSAFPGRSVCFEGFLSPKPGKRRNQLSELLAGKKNFVLYESPHRILKLMADLADLESERPVLLGRELTKIHEELLEGTASEVLTELQKRATIKGEIALLVGVTKKG